MVLGVQAIALAFIFSLSCVFAVQSNDIELENLTSITNENRTFSNINNCWHNFSQSCVISAIFSKSEFNEFDVNIDCSTFNATVIDSPYFDRFSHIPKISWNGCNSTDFLEGMGLSLIVDAASVVSLEISEFHIKNLEQNVLENFSNLRSLLFQNNDIENVCDETFERLKSLEELKLKHNQLQTIELLAFKGLQSLKHLMIQDNNVEELTVDLGSLSTLESLELAGFGRIGQQTLSSLLKNDGNLKILYLTYTTFDGNSFTVPTLESLEILNVINCQIVYLQLDQPNLQHLNMSGNAVKSEIYLHLHNMTSLKSLDFSLNQFSALRNHFCDTCVNLEILNLQHNQIKFIAYNFMETNPKLKVINLSDNQLRSLLPNTAILHHVSLDQIIVDHNPWSCAWIVDLSRLHGEVFAKLNFARVLNKLNINGLECQVYDGKIPEKEPDTTVTPSPASPAPSEEPTTEEINFLTLCLILTMTVVFIGILLALSTHLYERYKNMQHTPFYRLVLRSNRASTTSSNDHIMLRKLPATGYEVPISMRRSLGDIHKNIYEEIPYVVRREIQGRSCPSIEGEDDGVCRNENEHLV